LDAEFKGTLSDALAEVTRSRCEPERRAERFRLAAGEPSQWTILVTGERAARRFDANRSLVAVAIATHLCAGDLAEEFRSDLASSVHDQDSLGFWVTSCLGQFIHEDSLVRTEVLRLPSSRVLSVCQTLSGVCPKLISVTAPSLGIEARLFVVRANRSGTSIVVFRAARGGLAAIDVVVIVADTTDLDPS